MAVPISRMRDALTDVARTRSSAPTSASTSGRPRVTLPRAMSSSTASPPRLSPARYRSIASGTIWPIDAILGPSTKNPEPSTMRHTKIIATVGPASDSEPILDALIAAGTDIFRLNFSHGTHESHAATFARLRAASRRAGREVAILQDLSGPKIRTGLLEGGKAIALKPGDTVMIITGDGLGGPGRLYTTFEGSARSVSPGHRLLLADGRVELRVESTNGTEIRATVIEGGEIGEH